MKHSGEASLLFVSVANLEYQFAIVGVWQLPQ